MPTAIYADQIQEVAPDEANELFDGASRRWFKVSGRAFARAYDCGLIDRDTAKAQFVESLRRLAR